MDQQERKQWNTDQVEGLQRLSEIIRQAEVNFVLVPPSGDMAYIEMLDTPQGPHAVFDPSNKTYDIWKWGQKRPLMKHINLTAEDAAEILITEYFMAKAKRARKFYPDKSMSQIMETLRRGYQRGQKGEPQKTQ